MGTGSQKRLFLHSLLLILNFLLLFSLSVQAQKRKTSTKKKAQTTRVVNSKKNTKTTSAKNSINGLKNQSAQIKRNIKEQERKLRTNERDVKQRLQNLMVINMEIEGKRKSIDTIRHEINTLDENIGQLNSQLKDLQAELDDRKQKYIKSMRYMHRNSSIQSQLMFIFSAKNFKQMYRRLRFMREYASYQRAQGEMVKAKQAEITQKHARLTSAKKEKNTLLYKGEVEKRNLEGKQVEQQNVVASLKKQQKTIQGIIAQQRKKDEAINAQIDRLVAIEVEKARQRAIAEAKRKAEAEAAKKRAEEMKKRKANENDTREHKSNASENNKKPSVEYTLSSEDRRLSGNFANNRGRLPMPITGSYKIVSHFGQYNVEGLNNVRLDNKGINILGKSGACARSIFDGEVSAVFNLGGTTGVIVRHGSYISVYCNLSSVSVHQGQHVSTRQTLGTVGQDNILQFQLRKEKAKLNPEAWLAR